MVGGSPVAVGAVEGAGSASVVVGVRPEHLRVTADGPVRGTVRQVEWLGHEALVRVELDGAPEGLLPWIVRVGSESHPPAPGDAIRLAVDPDHAHVFDADSGARLSRSPSAQVDGPAPPAPTSPGGA